MFWGYAATECIIKNTDLARLRGTGKNTVIVPEMEAFGKLHGFCRITIKRSCQPQGRRGAEVLYGGNKLVSERQDESLEDMNHQALDRSTVRMDNRPVAEKGLIPAEAFEHERSYLVKLPPHLPPPYLVHERATDQHGYISFDGNYHWVPETKREEVRVFEYGYRLKKVKSLQEYFRI
jgi:hypothetical protein